MPNRIPDKTGQIIVRMRPAQIELLRDASRSEGLALSEYVRAAIAAYMAQDEQRAGVGAGTK